MDLMIAKKKGENNLLVVILQSNGYVVEMNCDEPIKFDDLLFPKDYDENLSMYLSSSIQGLLSNPNVVKDLCSLEEHENLFPVLFKAEEIALRLCYDTPLTEFVPLEQSFLRDKETCLKLRMVEEGKSFG